MEGCRNQVDLKTMELSCHLALAFMEVEEENQVAAEEQIRQAIRVISYKMHGLYLKYNSKKYRFIS